MRDVKRLALIAVGAIFAVSLMASGSASATLVCKAEPVEEEEAWVCPEPGKNGYGVNFFPGTNIGGTLTGKATFESIEGAAGVATCTESSFTAALQTNGTSKAGEGITKTSFNSGGGKECTYSLEGAPVAITAENLSYDASKAEYEGLASPEGGLTVAKGGGAVQIKMVVSTKTQFTCIYQPSEALLGNWRNGAGAVASKAEFVAKKFVRTSGGFSCPTKMRLNAVYNLKGLFENTQIYIAS